MSASVWRALLGLELRRAVTIAGKLLAFTAVAAALLGLSGSMSVPRAGLLLSVAATAFAMQVPVGIMRDKLDGGLEFLVSLPVPAAHLAAGRFVATVACCLPASLALALALHVSRPRLEVAFPLGPLGAFLAIWVGMNALCLLMVGLALRFEARTTLYLPVGLGFAGALFDEISPRIGWDPAASARWLVAQPWAPTALSSGTLVATAALVWLAFHLGRTGLERYTPGRDRITW